MEAIIISKNEFNELIEKIDSLKLQLDNLDLAKTKKRWLSIPETCEYLDVSKRTLQNYRDKGLISFSQYANKILFRLEDLDDFLMSNYNRLETAGKSSSFYTKSQRA